MAAYPINSSPKTGQFIIPETKFHSKSLIISIVKPIFEEIDRMENNTLRNLDSIITKHAKDHKKRTKLEIGTNKLIFELYESERMLSDIQLIESKNVVNLGRLMKKNEILIEQIKTAKKINPEKLQDAIDTLSLSGKFKPEATVVMNALVSAIPSKNKD